MHLAAIAADHSQAHARIRISSLRIFFLLDPGMRRQPVGDGICRHPVLIHLQKNNFVPFRRPEEVAAHGQFFGVNPVDFAVQNVVVFVFIFILVPVFFLAFLFFLAREWTFTFLSRDWMDIEIVLAHVGEALAVRRKLRVFARVR